MYLAYFGVGDPEQDGHHWNFSRAFQDDDGVCTVREIQQACIYDGILSFKLTRGELRCVFRGTNADHVGVKELRIQYDLDDPAWLDLATTLDTVFRGKLCYERLA